jgi:hypothetical protein
MISQTNVTGNLSLLYITQLIHIINKSFHVLYHNNFYTSSTWPGGQQYIRPYRVYKCLYYVSNLTKTNTTSRLLTYITTQ